MSRSSFSPTQNSHPTHPPYWPKSLVLKLVSGKYRSPFSYYNEALKLFQNTKQLTTKHRALGGLPNKYPSLEIAKHVNIDYPVSGATTFANVLAPSLAAQNKKFRFWYVSGKAVERDLSKPLWVLQDARRIKVKYLVFGEMKN